MADAPSLDCPISTRVTREEKEKLLAAAEALHMRPAEYYRRALIGDQSQVGLRIVLAEVRALRTMVLQFQLAQARGYLFTEEFVASVIADAEANRFQRADQVLKEGLKDEAVSQA